MSAQGYRSPGPDIEALVDAPLTPIFRPSPCKRHALLIRYTAAPPLEQIAQPFVGLAGARIDTKTGTSRSTSHVHAIEVVDLHAEEDEEFLNTRHVSFPDNFKRIIGVSWSPGGDRVAISALCDEVLRLFVLEVESMTLHDFVPDVRLNDVIANEMRWAPGGQSLILVTVPAERGAMPEAPLVPAQPMMQETRGRTATVRTYQDLLETSHDEDLLTYFATSQLVELDVTTGSTRLLGKPGLYSTPTHSPDGSLMLIRRLKKPFSFLVPMYYFGSEVELWDAQSGEFMRTVASLPVAEEVPQQGVRTGPRAIPWQPLEPAQLFWTEALDGGDPRAEVEHRLVPTPALA